MSRTNSPPGGWRWSSILVVALLVGSSALLAGGAAVVTVAAGSQSPAVATIDAGPQSPPAVVTVAAGSQSPPAAVPDGSTAALTQDQTQVCDRSAEPLVGAFNGNIERVPEFLRVTVQDTEIHGIFRNDTRRDYTFVTDSSGKIQSYRAGLPDSPSLRMITDCETLATISTADDPTAAFWSEYRNNEIQFVGVGIFNWLLVEALTHIPLLLLILVLVLAYVGYRRYSILSRGREGEAGLQRTDVDAEEPPGGEDGGAGEGGGGSDGSSGGGGGGGGGGGE